MTMFTLPNFCRVCLKYDKNLIDLAHIENEPSETLMSKLQLCVSEVEWSTYKPLLCHPCIKRLNIAYSFKKQCVQSAGVLKGYLELVKESQKKNESPSAVKTEGGPLPQTGAFMLLPNQKYVKILVGSQNQGTTGNTFQNVFLNLIPTSALNTVASGTGTSTSKNKDTNQNVFLNLNNTFQKFVPIAPVEIKKNDSTGKKSNATKNSNVNELLGDGKAEEMSVEIDPTSFLQLEQGESDSDNEADPNDWDEVISKTKIDPKEPKLANGDNKVTNGKESAKYSNYVPILPKQEDFFNSGQHFLSGSLESNDIICESCQKPFPSIRFLKHHIKQFHLGKFPFKCEYCYVEYVTREQYEMCVRSHKPEVEITGKDSLTLKDFASLSDELNVSLISNNSMEQNLSPNEDGDYACNVCHRIFNSSTGLLRHKVRKHNQKNRKKYFIKGMKNARCDICQREFSTQSYMQLHRKLHLRDDIGYKYKVLGKSKYDIKGAPEGAPDSGDKVVGTSESKDDSNSEVVVNLEPEVSIKEGEEEKEENEENEDEEKTDSKKVPNQSVSSENEEKMDVDEEEKSQEVDDDGTEGEEEDI